MFKQVMGFEKYVVSDGGTVKTGLKKGVRGEENVAHKITEKDVRRIRELRGTHSQRELEKMFGISHSHISKIQRQMKWQEVANV